MILSRIAQPFAAWLDRRRVLKDLDRMQADDESRAALDDNNPLNRAIAAIKIDDRIGARHYLSIAMQCIPGLVSSSPETINVLVGLGDFDEVERFTQDGMKRFPGKVAFPEGYALAAEKKGDFAEALRRWEMVQKRFPSVARSYVAAAGCLRVLNRLEEADALASQAVRQFPEDVAALLERGRIAEARADWPAAYERWTAAAEYHPAGVAGAAQALHRMGRDEEAGTLLAAARMRFPLDSGIAVTAARIAEERGLSDDAARLWADVRRRFPRDPAGYREGIRWLREAQRWTEAFEIATQADDIFVDQTWPKQELSLIAKHMPQ